MTATATETLVELLAQKTNIKAALDSSLAIVDQEITSIECVLDMLNPADPNGEPVHGATKPNDIRDCKTHMMAATVMAKMNQGVVRVTPAAKVIKAADLSDAKVGSVAATLHNRMSASKEWEYVEPGTFRWTNYKESTPPSIKPPENVANNWEQSIKLLSNAFKDTTTPVAPRNGRTT